MHVFTDKMCMGFSCIYPGSGDRPSGYETVGTLQAEAHMRTRRKCPAYTHPKPGGFRRAVGCWRSVLRCEKKHMAYRKKYKPCILKYKALILKYMPYIFRDYKCL